MYFRATVLLGVCLVRIMSIGLLSMGYCLVRLLNGWATVFQVNVHWATLCRECVLGELSVGLVSGWVTVQIPLSLSRANVSEKERRLLYSIHGEN